MYLNKMPETGINVTSSVSSDTITTWISYIRQFDADSDNTVDLSLEDQELLCKRRNKS